MLHFCLAFTFVGPAKFCDILCTVCMAVSRVPVELDQWALPAPGQRRQASKGCSQFFALDSSTIAEHVSVCSTLQHESHTLSRLWLHDI